VDPPPPGATRGLGVYLASCCHPAVYAPRARLSTFSTVLFTHLRGGVQPVEKVGDGPVCDPSEPENESKTLQETAYSAPKPRAEECAKEFFNRLGCSPKFGYEILHNTGPMRALRRIPDVGKHTRRRYMLW
jgi:hypothetical protein